MTGRIIYWFEWVDMWIN